MEGIEGRCGVARAPNKRFLRKRAYGVESTRKRSAARSAEAPNVGHNMPSRKLLKSVLRGFLGTYVSRGSEFDGYLLFGFVLDSLSGADVDLTADVPSTPALVPLDELRRLAACKFREQLAKVGLPLSAVRNASLAIRKGPQRRSEVAVRGGLTKLSGFDLYFTARGVTDLGRAYEADAQMFVAPQDPSLFARSSRATNVCPTSASSGSAPTA